MNALMKTELSPLRVGRITGSRVGAILGLDPYSTRADVMREMVREYFGAEREFLGNEATDYGTLHEPDALACYETQQGVMTYGGGELVIHPQYDFLAVTPDGYVGDEGMIECKAPFRGTYAHWSEKPYYEAQMRLQMACAGRKWCDFVVWRNNNICASRIHNDAAWLDNNLAELQAFINEFNYIIANQYLAEPFLAERTRDDKDWKQAANDYLNTLAAFNDMENILKTKRQKLIELAGDMSVKGCGVQVIRSERAGSIAYAKAIKDLAPDADLSAYAGKPSVVFTVKEMK